MMALARRLGAVVLAAALVLIAPAALAADNAGWLAAARKELASARPLKVDALRPNAELVRQYARFELAFQLGGAYENPFDPDQIDVRASFTGPDGRTLAMPGFYWREALPPEKEGAEPSVRDGWKVRFAPTKPGEWKYVLTARDSRKATVETRGSFRCTAGDDPGFVRVHPKNPHYLGFESGKAYFPVGINLYGHYKLGEPMPADRPERCLSQLRDLAEHGGNFARLRADSWWLAIEMTPDKPTGFLGLFYYHQPADRPAGRVRRGEGHLFHVLRRQRERHGQRPVPVLGRTLQPIPEGERRAVREVRRLLDKPRGEAVDAEQAAIHHGPVGIQHADDGVGVLERVPPRRQGRRGLARGDGEALAGARSL